MAKLNRIQSLNMAVGLLICFFSVGAHAITFEEKGEKGDVLNITRGEHKNAKKI